MPTSPNPAGPSVPKAPRQPLLWAALAYAAGTALSAHLYRPPAACIAAVVVFLAAAAFWSRNRPRHAQVFALLTFLILPLLVAELRLAPTDERVLPVDSEVVISAHVVAAGEVIPALRGGFRQTVDVVTDRIENGAASQQLPAGIRVNLFDPPQTRRLSRTCTTVTTYASPHASIFPTTITTPGPSIMLPTSSAKASPRPPRPEQTAYSFCRDLPATAGSFCARAYTTTSSQPFTNSGLPRKRD